MSDYFGKGEDNDMPAIMGESKVSVIVQLAQAELSQAVVTARSFPRSLKRVIDQINQLATLDAETADECFYSLPRAGKPIKGPSVRFAEIVASSYGNCHSGSRIVATDRIEKVVIAEGVFWDLETGAKITKQIQRKISDKNGRIYNDDMITTTGNAAASIALREAILKGVPKGLWRTAYDRAEKVTLGTVQTLNVRRDQMVKAFAGYGVTPEQIFASLEVQGLDDIGLVALGDMLAVFQSIKSGEQAVESYFPAKVDKLAAQQAARGSAKQKVSKVEALEDPKPKPDRKESKPEQEKPEPTREAVDQDTGEVTDEDPTPAEKEPDPEAEDWEPNAMARVIIQDVNAMGREDLMSLHGEFLEAAEVEKPGLFRYIMENIDRIYS
jgi:hypothetical protein